MLQLAITGATGRMGRELLTAIRQDAALSLSAATVSSHSGLLGVDAGEATGIGKLALPLVEDLAANLAATQVVVDFTNPIATLNHLAQLAPLNIPIVIGTTGFNNEQLAAVKHYATQLPIVLAANYSVGITLMLQLLRTAAQVMGEQSDIEIIEMHHRHKVDAPSGTALSLGEVIADSLGRNLEDCAIYGRQGLEGPRDNKSIGFATLRGGDVVGEHTAIFAGLGERLEITHKASNRQTFAQGALRAASWLVGKPAGLYDMADVLSLK